MRQIFRATVAALAALLVGTVAAAAQATMSVPYSYLSTASNNSTLVYGGGPSMLQGMLAVNTTATTYYLKLYNKATAPTCGTDTPVVRLPVQANNQVTVPTEGLRFPLGIGFCLTGAIADSDNSNAATGVALNFSVAWQ